MPLAAVLPRALQHSFGISTLTPAEPLDEHHQVTHSNTYVAMFEWVYNLDKISGEFLRLLMKPDFIFLPT
jgi:hypothetical protein